MGSAAQIPQALALQHDPAAQPPPAQSFAWVHVFPTAQPAQGPPQSTSASAPFFLPSLQLVHLPPSHRPLAQSVVLAHVLPSTQSPQLPPQSTSLSAPFFVPSWQLVHTPPVHVPLSQSPARLLRVRVEKGMARRRKTS